MMPVRTGGGSNSVRVIPDELVREVIGLDQVIDLVEEGFREDHDQRHLNFHVVRERLGDEQGAGIFGIKSGLASGRYLGLKAGGYWGGNRDRGLPPHQSTMMLFSRDTGQPIALVGANGITGLRTGAAGAVATKHLARRGAATVGLIGCGVQGDMQVRAVAQVLAVARFRLWDPITAAAHRLAIRLRDDLGIAVEVAADGRSVVRGVDIIITATPGEGPVLRKEWVEPGQHINAIGADTAGKQELDTAILMHARLVVDKLAQCVTLGETQHLAAFGENAEDRVYAELGEVVAGAKPGRTADDQITVYDATGVTFQDLVVAGTVYDICSREDRGTVVSL